MIEILLPKHYKRNFWCLVTDFAFFGLGLAFIGPGTVIPSLLNELGSPVYIIGLISTLQGAFWLLPQLFAARYVADKPLKKPYILWPAGLGRLTILLMAVLIWATGARPAWLIVGMMVVISAVFWISDGLASVPWFDFFSKVIPPRRRGRLTSTGQVLSGLVAFLVGFVVEWMLSERGPGFPDNYAMLFFLGFVMLIGSLVAVIWMVEEKGASASQMPGWGEFLPQLWHVLKSDRVYRRYIITRQIYGLSALSTPFYMVYALERLGLPARVAGRYTSIGVVGGVLAAVLFGWLNERYGSKRVIMLSIILATMMPVFALLAPVLFSNPVWLAWGYGLVFFLSSATMSSMMPGWMTFVLELAPEVERPTYVGLTNTINGISMLFSAVGGLILQWSGNNYTLLFGITTVGLLLAWPLPFGMLEPRSMKKAQ